jgi:hypothetical protein
MPLTPPDRSSVSQEHRTRLAELARAARLGEQIAAAKKGVIDGLRRKLETLADDGDFRSKTLEALELESVTLMTEGAYHLGRANGLEAALSELGGVPHGSRDP